MPQKHMKTSDSDMSEKLLQDKDFKIDLLESQLQHKNNEIKDLKQDMLDILKRIIHIGEANHYNNSQNAVRKMKEIAEENYKRIAVNLYDLDLSNVNKKIELPTTDESNK
ncbi:MAG: hypothetical protein HFJ48_00855 [Clostridia bacterium]|nr:hypothetical protein [Clostridia bacterium]